MIWPGETPSPDVLVVDDSAEERGKLRRLLQDEGINVVAEGGDGLEAIDLVHQLKPDVVLMDLRMPRMGGIEATRRIRNVHHNTQVLILTVYEDPALNRSAEEVGAYAYLVKGCSIGLIRDMILQASRYKTELEAFPARSG